MDKLKILDGRDVPNPEDMAMLMAMYSRSPASVDDHLTKIKEVGSGKFMDKFYVRYSHASIGDCGDIAIFLEGISMLAAKAIQDDPLYNGQEASTRFMDFSKTRFLTATGSDREVELAGGWRGLYFKALSALPYYLTSKYSPEYLLPKRIPEHTTVDKLYADTIKAITFDIARGLLPCGAATNVAWKASLRKCSDHCIYLSGHPLLELQDIAKTVYNAAGVKEPNSFKFQMPSLPEYAKRLANYYYNVDLSSTSKSVKTIFRSEDSPDAMQKQIKYFCSGNDREIQRTRAHMPWPDALSYLVTYRIKGFLDFGSYRDLQRHRPGNHPVPLVGGEFGLSSWYMDQIRGASESLFKEVKELFSAIQFYRKHTSPVQAQYLFPMATLVPIFLEWPLEQLVYVTELRTSVSVHPTLREFMKKVFERAAEDLPILKEVVFPDIRGDYENSRRGDQNIVEK